MANPLIVQLIEKKMKTGRIEDHNTHGLVDRDREREKQKVKGIKLLLQNKLEIYF